MIDMLPVDNLHGGTMADSTGQNPACPLAPASASSALPDGLYCIVQSWLPFPLTAAPNVSGDSPEGGKSHSGTAPGAWAQEPRYWDTSADWGIETAWGWAVWLCGSTLATVILSVTASLRVTGCTPALPVLQVGCPALPVIVWPRCHGQMQAHKKQLINHYQFICIFTQHHCKEFTINLNYN